MSGIEVTRETDDGLEDRVWNFSMDIRSERVKLTIIKYAERSRPSKRHKMRTGKLWDRFDQRSYHSTITYRDVPMPPDVINEAMAQICFSIELPSGDIVGCSVPK